MWEVAWKQKIIQFQWKCINFIVYTVGRLQKMGKSNELCHFCKNNTETLQHLFFQCLKIKPIIEELNTMIIVLCDQTYVLNEEDIMLGVYLYDKQNIKEVLFVNFFIFVAKRVRWKFRNEIKYNNIKFDTLKIKQMLKIELKSNTALITKSLLLNKNIGKLLFENLQTKLA
jgi:hypothetical protein